MSSDDEKIIFFTTDVTLTWSEFQRVSVATEKALVPSLFQLSETVSLTTLANSRSVSRSSRMLLALVVISSM